MTSNLPIELKKLIPVALSSDLDLSTFDCNHPDLNDFIRNNALNYQKQNLAQTTCILYEDKVVAFYTLACDALYLMNKEKRKSDIPFLKGHYDTYPAIKICRMACINDYKSKRIGSYLIKLIIGKVYSLNTDSKIACKFITVDAYPGAEKFYEKQGFVRNQHPNYFKNTHQSAIHRIKRLWLKFINGDDIPIVKPVSMRLNIFKQNY